MVAESCRLWPPRIFILSVCVCLPDIGAPLAAAAAAAINPGHY